MRHNCLFALFTLFIPAISGCNTTQPVDEKKQLYFELVLMPSEETVKEFWGIHGKEYLTEPNGIYLTPAVAIFGQGVLFATLSADWQYEAIDPDGNQIIIPGGLTWDRKTKSIGPFFQLRAMEKLPKAKPGMTWPKSAGVYIGYPLDQTQFKKFSAVYVNLSLQYISQKNKVVDRKLRWKIWPKLDPADALKPID